MKTVKSNASDSKNVPGKNQPTQNGTKKNIPQPQASAKDEVEEVVKLTNAARKKILLLHSYGVNVADIHRIVQNEVQKEARYYDVYAAVKVAKNAELVEA